MKVQKNYGNILIEMNKKEMKRFEEILKFGNINEKKFFQAVISYAYNKMIIEKNLKTKENEEDN